MICDQGMEYHHGRIRASDDIIMQQSNLTRDRSRSMYHRGKTRASLHDNQLQRINKIKPIN